MALVSGLASAFLVYGTVVDDTIIKSKVGLHISVGNNAKAAGMPKASISGQISTAARCSAMIRLKNEFG